MFQKENWIILCINTIIIVVVLFVLFRHQDTKLRTHIRRIEKKMLYQKTQLHINPQQKNINSEQQLWKNDILYLPQNKSEETGSTQLIAPQSDIDSFYDPMQN